MRLMFALGLSLLAPACVLDEADEGDDLNLSTTEHALTGWVEGGFSSRTSFEGWNTGRNANTWTCVLSRVVGDLGEGGYWQAADVRSAAYIKPNSFNQWEVYAHGGAYANQTNDRVWANNVVGASAVCVPFPPVAISQPMWATGDLPQRLGAALPNRHCFLRGIFGGGRIFTHNGDYVRVKKYTTTDATHPQTGWYVEGNLVRASYTGQPAHAVATCIDFPSITNAWNPGTIGQGTTVLTSGSGVKMCGLQALEGSFNVDNVNDGVRITAPIGLWGQWSATVSTGNKSARIQCIE